MGGGTAQYLYDDMTDPEMPLFGLNTNIAPIELILWAAVGPTVKDSGPLRAGDAATMVLVADSEGEDIIPHFFEKAHLTQIISDQRKWLRRERCSPIEKDHCFPEWYVKDAPLLPLTDVCVYHAMFFLYEDDC